MVKHSPMIAEASQTMITDTHCHLDYLLSKGYVLEDILQNAEKNRVSSMITISTKINEMDSIVKIAEENHNIWCSVGVHPDSVAEEGVVPIQTIMAYIKHPKVIAIGETGLDYYRTTDFKKQQQDSFINHITVSQESGLPLVVHTREADEDTINILVDHYKQKEFNGLIHCFTASYELAKAVLDIGFMISISGIVTFKSAKELQEIVLKIPDDRLLVETDAPFLAPTPYRGEVNEPAYVLETTKFIAELKNVPLESFIEQLNINTQRTFPKMYV